MENWQNSDFQSVQYVHLTSQIAYTGLIQVMLLCRCLGGQEKEVYLSALRRDRQYGGEPEIEAICHSYNVSVELLIGGLNYPVQVSVSR